MLLSPLSFSILLVLSFHYLSLPFLPASFFSIPSPPFPSFTNQSFPYPAPAFLSSSFPFLFLFYLSFLSRSLTIFLMPFIPATSLSCHILFLPTFPTFFFLHFFHVHFFLFSVSLSFLSSSFLPFLSFILSLAFLLQSWLKSMKSEAPRETQAHDKSTFKSSASQRERNVLTCVRLVHSGELTNAWNAWSTIARDPSRPTSAVLHPSYKGKERPCLPRL